MQFTGQSRGTIYSMFLCVMAVLALSACSTHSKPVSLETTRPQVLSVIGLPRLSDQKQLDVRRENPVYAIIGLSAKLVQQVVRQNHRIKYQDANPKLHQYCVSRLQHGIRKRLRKLGYRVVELDMTYWQAQAAFRKHDARLKGVDALLDLRIKRFGYFSSSPYKPYRPGMIVTADLVSTHDRKMLSSNVYNVGYDRNDISKFDFQVSYMTNIHVADTRYFYRDFKTLMQHAKASSKGLKFVAGVAAESVAGDLHQRYHPYSLASRR